jgi:hypothetical protein
VKWLKRRSQAEEAEETRRLVRHAAQLHGIPADEVVRVVFDEDDEVEPERPRSKVGLFITLSLIGVVFGLGIVGLMWLSNSSDKAGPTAVAGLEDLKKSIAPTPPANPTLSGIHISFVYPGVFDTVTRPAGSDGANDRYTLGSKSDYRKTIQVYVEKESSYTADSGYLFRSISTGDYTKQPVKVMGEAAVIMVKSDNSERTLYWEHAGNLVIMSATGEGNVLQGYMDVITASLRWLQ